MKIAFVNIMKILGAKIPARFPLPTAPCVVSLLQLDAPQKTKNKHEPHYFYEQGTHVRRLFTHSGSS